MELKSVVPWGRSAAEYKRMFKLEFETFDGLKVLGVGDGPASFNAEMSRSGLDVVSVDPLYQFSREEIAARIKEVTPWMETQLFELADQYIWEEFKDVAALVRARLSSMDTFLADYHAGKKQGRYIYGALPKLPIESASFDLALSSHLLFLYDDMLDQEFHLRSLLALTDLAAEARVFPIVNRQGEVSQFLNATIQGLEEAGRKCSLERVEYRFQKGADMMLRINRR